MGLLCTLINLYLLAVFGFIILSWFPLNPGGVAFRIFGYLRMVVDPVLSPLRRVLPRIGPLDISPIILILGISVVERLLGCGGGFL
jgi:YggT family protein